MLSPICTAGQPFARPWRACTASPTFTSTSTFALALALAFAFASTFAELPTNALFLRELEHLWATQCITLAIGHVRGRVPNGSDVGEWPAARKDEGPVQVGPGQRGTRPRRDIRSVAQDSDVVAVEIGSGDYEFEWNVG